MKALVSGRLAGTRGATIHWLTASAAPSLDPRSLHALLRQPAFGVEGGHAAGAGRGDRLTVGVVGDVPGGENACHYRET